MPKRVAACLRGPRLESIEGDASIQPVQATDDPASVAHVDTILVAVKTWQLADAIASMGSMVGPETAVLPLLNEVEASD